MTVPRADLEMPVVYDRNAILTAEQVARGLQISVRSVEKADLPCFYVGRLPRYLWGVVLDAVKEKSK